MNTRLRPTMSTDRQPTAAIEADEDAIDVILIGHTGQVGRAVRDRLEGLRNAEGRHRFRLREAINRREHAIDGGKGLEVRDRRPGALAELGQRLAVRMRPALIVDCTADPDLPRLYPDWLAAGIGIVTPNKHGFAGDRVLYDRIQAAARLGDAPLGYTATVGAGLPVLSTLRRLHASDRPPARITAVVSGTLVQVFSRMSDGATLSSAVEAARAAGCTEPDPLEDLSGRDVARKLRILMREAGWNLNATEPVIHREPVVDDRWVERVRGTIDVIEALKTQDARWTARLDAAARSHRRWIYRATFDAGTARVGPTTVADDDPFAHLGGSDNRLMLADIGEENTRVVIEGPGAGIDVTATSVLSDLAEAAERLRVRAQAAIG